MSVKILICLANIPVENRDSYVVGMLAQRSGDWEKVEEPSPENDYCITYERIEDRVNHPPHYTQHPIECIDVSENLNFNLGNALKYVWRHTEKGNSKEDLAKAEWYLRREVIRRHNQESYKPSLAEAITQFDDSAHQEILSRILLGAVDPKNCSDLAKAISLIRLKMGVASGKVE